MKIAALVEFAGGLPDVTEGIACAGTALEKRTLRIGKKAFLFASAKDLMFKLADSLAAARQLAAKQTESIRAGAGGWVKVTSAAKVETAQLKTWIRESYGLMGGR